MVGFNETNFCVRLEQMSNTSLEWFSVTSHDAMRSRFDNWICCTDIRTYLLNDMRINQHLLFVFSIGSCNTSSTCDIDENKAKQNKTKTRKQKQNLNKTPSSRHSYLNIAFEINILWKALGFFLPNCWYLWPLLLTWFNFNPSMDK